MGGRPQKPAGALGKKRCWFEELFVEINDHVGFIAAIRAFPVFLLFLLLGARRGLDFDELARNDHFRFIPALGTGTDFPLFCHLAPPLD